MDRREFLGKGAKLALGSAAFTAVSAADGAESKKGTAEDKSSTGKKKRLAMVGTGGRASYMWGRNLFTPYKDYVELVGLCDINRKRTKASRKLIAEAEGAPEYLKEVPTYHSSEFDRMIKETSPEAVLVITTDCFHSKYIVRAMELGCDGVVSSPLEAEPLRQGLGSNFLVVTPGIRPGLNREVAEDDQKRIATAQQAIINGADHVVVGRPISQSPDPIGTVQTIQEEIARGLESL